MTGGRAVGTDAAHRMGHWRRIRLLALAAGVLVPGGVDGLAAIVRSIIPAATHTNFATSPLISSAEARSRGRGGFDRRDDDRHDDDRRQDRAPQPMAPSRSDDGGGRGGGGFSAPAPASAPAAAPVMAPAAAVAPTPPAAPAAETAAPQADGGADTAAKGASNGVSRGAGEGRDGGQWRHGHGPRAPRTVVEAWGRFKHWMDQPSNKPPAGAAAARHMPAPAAAALARSGHGDGDRGHTAAAAVLPGKALFDGRSRQQERKGADRRPDPGDGKPARGGEARRAPPIAPSRYVGEAAAAAAAVVAAAKGSGNDAAVAELKSKVAAAKAALKQEPAALPQQGTFVGNEIVATDLTASDVERLRGKGFGVRLGGRQSSIGVLTSPEGLDAAAAIETARNEVPSASIGFNRVYRPFKANGGLPTSPPRDIAPVVHGVCPAERCFGLRAIGWRPDLGVCASSVRIGVLDTRVDLAHPAFVSGHVRNGDFHTASGKPASNWHGTGVLALLAGHAESGTPGLVPDGEFYVADVFYADQRGEPTTDTAALILALDWLDQQEVKVVNMSLAGPPDGIMKAKIAELAANGVVIVAAAGNEGPAAPPVYPAAYEQVIAVTAIDRDKRNYRYANRGPYIDVAAPGVDVWTAVPGNRGGLQTGTSFATPFVTAAVAALYPSVDPKTKAALLAVLPADDLGPPGRDPVYGKGMLKAPDSCRSAPPTSWPAVAMPASPAEPAAPVPVSITEPVGMPAATPASLSNPATTLSFSPAGPGLRVSN